MHFHFLLFKQFYYESSSPPALTANSYTPSVLLTSSTVLHNMVAFTPSSDRLIHYLSAARNATPEAAAQICVFATADPYLYQFGELLSFPTIAALPNTPHHKSHQLLLLFAYGSVDDYRAIPSSFPPLSEPHWKKLRVLTLVSLANGNSILHYQTLQDKLGVSTVREVEDVVLDAIYAGMVRARMDQRAARVEILSAVGRDVVSPTGVADMIATMKAWVSRSTQLVEEIDDKINFISHHAALSKQQKAQAAANVDATKKQIWSEGGASKSSTESDTSREAVMRSSLDGLPNVTPHLGGGVNTRSKR